MDYLCAQAMQSKYVPLFICLAGLLGWVVITVVRHKRQYRADTDRLATRTCRWCGHPYGHDAAASRRSLGITSVVGWHIRCSSCGRVSDVYSSSVASSDD